MNSDANDDIEITSGCGDNDNWEIGTTSGMLPQQQATSRSKNSPAARQNNNILRLNIPRPEDVVVLQAVFATISYVLFLIVGIGHILAVTLAFTATLATCLILVGLGKVSEWIARSRMIMARQNNL